MAAVLAMPGEAVEIGDTRLRYVCDDQPGIRRRRAGRGWMYVGPGGERVDDRSAARIRALAVPPAWTDVWICTRPDGHLQATGRDEKGRKQYRYHTSWRAARDAAKFEHLAEFGAALPRIRRVVERDLRGRGLEHDNVVALVVRLLETSLVRVGNEEYAQTNGSYGLTTLRSRHARVNGREVRLEFRGKHGRLHRTVIDDPRVAKAVRACQELPGQLLFQYETETGLRAVQSDDVNEYLRSHAGVDVTAKDYRTWMGTVLAATRLAALDPPTSAREAAHAVQVVMTEVSALLANTPRICRASYVHPEVVARFERGELPARWARPATATPRGLSSEERRLLALLASARRKKVPQAA